MLEGLNILVQLFPIIAEHGYLAPVQTSDRREDEEGFFIFRFIALIGRRVGGFQILGGEVVLLVADSGTGEKTFGEHAHTADRAQRHGTAPREPLRYPAEHGRPE